MKFLYILFLLCFLGCSPQFTSSISSDTPLIKIGIQGIHDHLVQPKYLCNGIDDHVNFKEAIKEIRGFGGGEILFLPGSYNWYNRDYTPVKIDVKNIHIKGIGRSAKIVIMNNLDAMTILGQSDMSNLILEGIVFEVGIRDYSSTILTLLANSTFKVIRNVKVENVGFVNKLAFEEKQKGSCINNVPLPYGLKLIAINKKKGSYLLDNNFSELDFDGFETAISIETRGSVYPWINGNYFESVFIDNVSVGVNFFELNTKNKEKWKGYNHNTFSNVKVQTRPFTQIGFNNISGNGNVFNDCHIWDWQKRCSKGNTHKFVVRESAQNTYMNILRTKGKDVKNNGVNTNLTEGNNN